MLTISTLPKSLIYHLIYNYKKIDKMFKYKFNQFLYPDKCKTLMKEIRKTEKNARCSCSCIGIIVNTVKMLILSKVSYRFSAIPIEISVIFFIEIERESKYIYIYETTEVTEQTK